MNGMTDFTEIHHALLFGWLANAVVERVGEQRGEAVIRQAVRKYGEQRGQRMARRAVANGHALDMAAYIAYAEYRVSPGAIPLKVVERSPNAKARIPTCPWYVTWKKNSLLSVGRLYCLDVDQALVRGFNPELRLDVNATLTNGAAECEFVYYGANLTIPNYLKVQYRRTINPGAKAVMSWEYHAGHLLTTLEKVVVEELSDVGKEAVEAGLAEFGSRCGEQAMRRLLANRGRDYTAVA